MLLVRCSGLHFDVLQLTSPFIEGRFSVSLLAVGVQRTADVLHVPTGLLAGVIAVHNDLVLLTPFLLTACERLIHCLGRSTERERSRKP